jgi:Lipid A core - O-antigen ligase and related enzymes
MGDRLASHSIFKNKVLVSSMLFLLVRPASFDLIDILDWTWLYGSTICAVLLVLIALFLVPIEKTEIWIFAFFFSLFFSTVVGSGKVYEYMRTFFPSLAMCLLFSIWIKKSPETLLDAFSVLEILVYINLFSILLHPKGMYETTLYTANWFLGYKNVHIRTILPILSMSCIRSYVKFRRLTLRTYLLIITATVTMFLVGSATSLVGIVSFMGALFIFHSKGKELPKWITLLNATVATVVASVMILVFRIQEVFSFLIVEILNRDLTFTTRTNIWDRSLKLFREKMIWGQGYLPGRDFTEHLGSPYATHPHHFFLYLLVMGGCVFFFVLLWSIFSANRELNESIDSVCSKVVLFTLVAFLIMGLAEALVGTVLLYPMLILAMNVKNIVKLENKTQSAVRKIKIKFRTPHS